MLVSMMTFHRESGCFLESTVRHAVGYHNCKYAFALASGLGVKGNRVCVRYYKYENFFLLQGDLRAHFNKLLVTPFMDVPNMFDRQMTINCAAHAASS